MSRHINTTKSSFPSSQRPSSRLARRPKIGNLMTISGNISLVEHCVSMVMIVSQETLMPSRVYRHNGWKQPHDRGEPHYFDLLRFDDARHAFKRIFGLGSMEGSESGAHDMPVQERGTTKMSAGRLITWPSVLAYCISGEARHVPLIVIDRNIKICSITNVSHSKKTGGNL